MAVRRQPPARVLCRLPARGLAGRGLLLYRSPPARGPAPAGAIAPPRVTGELRPDPRRRHRVTACRGAPGVPSARMPKVRRRQPCRGGRVSAGRRAESSAPGRPAGVPRSRWRGGVGSGRVGSSRKVPSVKSEICGGLVLTAHAGGHGDKLCPVVVYFRLFLLESCFKFKTEKVIKRHFRTH